VSEYVDHEGCQRHEQHPQRHVAKDARIPRHGQHTDVDAQIARNREVRVPKRTDGLIFGHDEGGANFVPVNWADNILHLALGGGMIVLGKEVVGRRDTAAPAV
jgi:hypothetical protein